MMDDCLTAIMNTAGRYKLLSADEEIELSRRVQRWIALRDKNKDELTTEERQAIKSGVKAKNRMIECNLRLVVSISRHYISKLKDTVMQREDIISEGILGLNRAVELFDGARGYKFSTYAYRWICQKISRSIGTHRRCTRIPGSALDKLNKARKIQQEYLQKYQEPASLEFVAKQINMKVEVLRLAIERSAIHLNLEPQLIEDMTRSDQCVFDQAEQSYEHEKLQQALTKLDKEEYDIIKNFYGLDGKTPKTLQQLASKKTICLKHISQKHNDALSKLEVAMNCFNLTADI